MSDAWTDRLSEYLDDELPPAERAALEAHLALCPDCAATLDELRRVVARLAALEDRPPARDLWPGIAAGIAGAGAATEPRVIELPGRRASRPARRLVFSAGQLAAAAVAAAFLSGAAVWLLGRASTPIPTARAGPGDALRPDTVAFVRFAAVSEPGYDAAVADLERVLRDYRDRLDPATVRVLEENLRIIDQAIADARRALAADPGNQYLNRHLLDNMQRKIELLRRVATLANVQT